MENLVEFIKINNQPDCKTLQNQLNEKNNLVIRQNHKITILNAAIQKLTDNNNIQKNQLEELQERVKRQNEKIEYHLRQSYLDHLTENRLKDDYNILKFSNAQLAQNILYLRSELENKNVHPEVPEIYDISELRWIFEPYELKLKAIESLSNIDHDYVLYFHKYIHKYVETRRIKYKDIYEYIHNPDPNNKIMYDLVLDILMFHKKNLYPKINNISDHTFNLEKIWEYIESKLQVEGS